jgi:hypothetical protein
MTRPAGPIYEVSFAANPDVISEFDRWLDGHARSIQSVAGITRCAAFAVADDADGNACRVCLYALESDAALDAFLEADGGNIDNDVEAEFPKQVSVTARVLREDRREEVSGGSPDCLNCGAYLRGQYCAVCGQRSRSRLISLWELIRDAFGDLFEIDSRLWQTLVPLLIRPGRLTHDYLQGRRARYMPPFRMYLVLSLLFFVVAFFDPREDLSLLFEPEPAPQTAAPGSTSDAVDARQRIREQFEELAEEGTLAADQVPGDINIDDSGFAIQFDQDGKVIDNECEIDASDVEDMPDWLARRLTPERLIRICERTQIDGGRAFLDKMLDNVPAALIILLPIMAFVLKALYPLSRRYYVEHLLFFVHFHAFFFLILSMQVILMRLSGLLGIPEGIAVLAVVVAAFYIPVYLFISIRRVYGQGRLITFAKYAVLLLAYVTGFGATMLGAAAIAAFSV